MPRFQQGQLLGELLIALAIGVTLAAIGAQLVAVSLNATKSSKGRNEALGLAQEGIEAVRAIIRGNDASSQGWNRIYLPPDGAGTATTSKGDAIFYHPEVFAGAWRLASSSESIVIQGETYTRTINIYNVCRNTTTKAITGTWIISDSADCAGGSSDDPATQKVKVTVSKSGEPDVIIEEYFARYLNDVTPQTDWAGTPSESVVSATSTSNIVGTDTSGSAIIDRTNAACGGGQCVRLKQ